MGNGFGGFSEETYRFLMELGFNNESAFYHANKDRCRKYVQEPMWALAECLAPCAGDIDPAFVLEPRRVVSRMNRDTRIPQNKLRPYRDNIWIGYKRAGERTGESFCVYVEISPKGYGYGVGMYSANPELMKPFRAHAAADPGRLTESSKPLLDRGFTLEGEAYRRDHFPDAPEAVKPYINRKGISWCYFSEDITRTYSPDFADEVLAAMKLIKPVYRFVTCMN